MPIETRARVEAQDAENLEGTVSREWHDMVEYTLRTEIERLRDVARKQEVAFKAECEQLQAAAEGWCATASDLVDEVRAAETEITKLHDALHKMDERYGCVVSASGQGRDGKWHEIKTCLLCGATIKTQGQGHKEHCAFRILENKSRKVRDR